MPLDCKEALTWSLTLAAEPTTNDELDWSFEDEELARSLQAIKTGRGATLALLVAAAATLGTALVMLG